MEEQSNAVFQRILSLVSLAMVVLGATTAQAKTHTIQFGGSLGIVYSPNTLNVSVGDTIQWEGDFSMHPLSSTGVPSGAPSFHQGSGATFSYVVAVAGTYSYQCDIHFSLGMVGSFTAVTTGIKETTNSFQPGVFKLDQNFPNPFNPTTTIEFTLPQNGRAIVKVYDVVGREVATLVDRGLAAGTIQQVKFDGTNMPSGIYIVRLWFAQQQLSRKILLLK